MKAVCVLAVVAIAVLGHVRCMPERIPITQDPCNVVNCFVAPCQFARCDNIDGAVCEDNYCGGCNAIWKVDGKDVTSECVSVAVVG